MWIQERENQILYLQREIYLRIHSSLADDTFELEFLTDNDICIIWINGGTVDTRKHLIYEYYKLFINSWSLQKNYVPLIST